MPLTPGARLGPYEIVAVAGAGGMGEVYRARDTRLGREVAIKVLPEHLSGDAGRRERFEREARAVSALNHPHICVLYDIGSEGGADYLVMEHLEGETIADRLLRGALPPDQVLRYAAEIADALAKAHRHGIVHRDLKPANVMLTRTGAKLLDFGLAKLREAGGAAGGSGGGAGSGGAAGSGRVPGAGGAVGSGGAPGGSMLPTATRDLTTAGTLLGTFQYMAPEQLEGKEADARTDIFAFGSLVYEMTTARRAFEGGSQASLIAAIMGKEPAPFAALAPVAPPALERIVRRCLAKDPEDRWQSAGDLAHALRELAGISSVVISGASSGATSGATSAPSGGMAASGITDAAAAARAEATAARRGGVPAAVAAGIAILLAAATGVAAWMMRPEPPPRERLRATINLPSTMRLDPQNPPFAFSPDGRTLAIVAVGSGGKPMLHLRRLDARDPQPLAGTEGASYPFWSPDGRYLGFFAERKLKKIPANGGTVVSLCDVVDGRGASWGRTGVIAFSPSAFGGLSVVPEAGGAPTPLTSTDQPSVTHRLPWFLPDGKHLLYFNGTISGDKKNGIHVLDVETKKDTPLLDLDSGVAYAAPGWITFVRDQNVLAQKFDAATLKLQGEAIPIAEGIHYNPARWSGAYAVSDQGALVYQAGGASFRSQFTWFDHDGKKLGTIGEPTAIVSPVMAPDGKRVAYGRFANTSGGAEIWILDLARGVSSRLSFGSVSASLPRWSPDSQRITFTDGDGQILIKRADGAGEAEVLVKGHDRLRNPSSWTPDGSHIFFRLQDPATGLDLMQVATGGDHEIKNLLVTPANETDPQLSPDGHLLAYRSDESGGTMQLFIVPYPNPGGKWQVTSSGADGYEWAPDGRSIVYEASDGKLYSVGLQMVNGGLELGTPAPFFGGEAAPNGWTLGRDGKRLLGVVAVNEGPVAPLELDLGWSAAIPGS